MLHILTIVVSFHKYNNQKERKNYNGQLVSLKAKSKNSFEIFEKVVTGFNPGGGAKMPYPPVFLK